MGHIQRASVHEPPVFDIEELEAQELLESVDLEAIMPLLHDGVVQTLGPGEVLIEGGSFNPRLYLLLSGELSVRLRSSGCAPLLILGPGQSVGELSLIDHKPASATIVAEVESRVLALDEELVWILVNSSHAISSNLLFLMVKRLRYGNDLLVQQQEKLEQFKFCATVDPLTGLFNRRWMDSMLPRQIERTRRCKDPLSVIMLDVDYFKRYNDEHGHLAGDQVLRTVGREIRDNVRPGDFSVRYGGEEFLAILPECNLEGARIVAERLRLAISAATTDSYNNEALPAITISLGAAEFDPVQTVNALIDAADTALFRAKKSGRDRVSS